MTTLEQQYETSLNTYREKHARFTAGGRTPTPDEVAALNTIVVEANSLKDRVNRARGDAAMSAEIGRLTDGMTLRFSGRPSLGRQFVESEAMRWLQDTANSRAGAWSSPAVELHATTLDESSGSGGPLVVPAVQPGIIPLPTRPPVVRDLIAPGATSSNLIQFMREKTFTNAAAAVAEGAAKPESTLVFEAATSPVRKLAHWIPATDEILSDVAQMESYINARLVTGLQVVEDDELLNGSGVTPHLLGYTLLPGLAPAVARGTDSNVDAIAKQIAAIATATKLAPDGVVMHPTNWQSILLAKLATGEYASGSSPLDAFPRRQLWGLQVALSTAIALNSALVGCFKTASQCFARDGIRVEASNSHQDFFVKNLVAIRAEERLALAVYRESAFGLVTGLT